VGKKKCDRRLTKKKRERGKKEKKSLEQEKKKGIKEAQRQVKPRELGTVLFPDGKGRGRGGGTILSRNSTKNHLREKESTRKTREQEKK